MSNKRITRAISRKFFSIREKANDLTIAGYVRVTTDERIKLLGAVAIISAIVIPEIAIAADDGFQVAHTKIMGWTTGSAGKLITGITLLIGLVAGALGSWKAAIAPIVVGVGLAASETFVNMIFPAKP